MTEETTPADRQVMRGFSAAMALLTNNPEGEMIRGVIAKVGQSEKWFIDGAAQPLCHLLNGTIEPDTLQVTVHFLLTAGWLLREELMTERENNDPTP